MASNQEKSKEKPNYKLTRHFMAGCIARLSTEFLFSPVDTLKSRIMFSGFNSSNLFRSSAKAVLISAPSSGFSFLIYHYSKAARKRRSYNQTKTNSDNLGGIFNRKTKALPFDLVDFMLGRLSRTMVITIKNPLDIAKHYFHLKDVHNLELNSVSEVFKYSYNKYGLVSLFDGFTPFFLRDLISDPIYWNVYDRIKEKQISLLKNRFLQKKKQKQIQKENKKQKQREKEKEEKKRFLQIFPFKRGQENITDSTVYSHNNSNPISKKWFKDWCQLWKTRIMGKVSENERGEVNVMLGPVNHVVSSTIATLIATTASAPFDVIKYKMQTRRFVSDGNEKYGNLFKSFRTVWSEEGLKGFAKGLSTKLAVLIPSTAFTFVVYEGLINTFERNDRMNNLITSMSPNCVYDFNSKSFENQSHWDNPVLLHPYW
ncbi:s-adenosylmethionine carrier protein [Anaeramoeba flamelloides]|uniref:S-adenosylmethionine carrier protein n=1 Tax=Anaeramoeba flamelloides TaxID=1746091 RepID=A0AAV7ZGM3_9EUKA|nr:s-adenosylmethionine carrier protein [Anaeramoeba flamelloides]